MSGPETDHGIRLVPQSNLVTSIHAFLLDCQARRLGPYNGAIP